MEEIRKASWNCSYIVTPVSILMSEIQKIR